MWRVGELLRTALSLFRDLRNLAEDVAQSHMGSVFPVWSDYPGRNTLDSTLKKQKNHVAEEKC